MADKVRKIHPDARLQNLANRIQLLGSLTSRVSTLSTLGYSYGTDRDLYQALGWKSEPSFDDYLAQFSRNAIASAVIKRPVNATWRGDLVLQETEEAEQTPFEEAWEALNKRLKLKSKFARLDKLVGIGEYGILLLGFDDVRNSDGWRLPAEGNRKLVYVRPLSQGSATISSSVEDTKDPRYGLPLFYNITTTLSSNVTLTLSVHYTRVMHVAGELLESEVLGVPRLKPVFNNVSDIEKLSGGSAEMFWRGARPGYQGKVDNDFTLTSDDQEDLEDQLDEYEHNLRRVLVNKGITFEALASQVADPSMHLDVQLQLISAETGIPKRILTGSERGELASSQDDDNWNNVIKARRDEYAEPEIIRPFVDLCIQHGVLPIPKTGNYTVVWADLWAQSEKEKVEIGRMRSESLKIYSEAISGQEDFPIKAAFAFLLGLNEEEIELLEEFRQEAMAEADTEVDEILGEGEEEELDESAIIDEGGNGDE